MINSAISQKNLIIAGGRNFFDLPLFKSEIRKIIFFGFKYDYDFTIFSGGASGADTLAINYAKSNNIPLQVFPAAWSRIGKQAGVLRNLEMASKADFALIFWDKKSIGTKHMITFCKKYRVPVRLVIY